MPKPSRKRKTDDQPKILKECQLGDSCSHVLVTVENVNHQLCKNRIIHHSDYFAKLLDENKWKESKQNAVKLEDLKTDDFILFINTVFPNDVQDFEPLGAVALRSLFMCADRFGSMNSALIIKRIIVSMDKMTAEKIADDCTLVLQSYSYFNLDQCQDLHQKIIELALTIPNVHKLEGTVKPSILLPVTCKLLEDNGKSPTNGKFLEAIFANC